MKQLLVLRHAKSSWSDPDLDDHDRPLNGRGRRDAPRMGRWLVHNGIVPERILSSTALRALTTARLVADACDLDAEPHAAEQLYLAPPAEYLEMLGLLDRAPDPVMVVGHNPGVEQLVEHLTGRRVAMPTAALARIELPIDRWSDLSDRTRGTLADLWVPKELPEEN